MVASNGMCKFCHLLDMMVGQHVVMMQQEVGTFESLNQVFALNFHIFVCFEFASCFEMFVCFQGFVQCSLLSPLECAIQCFIFYGLWMSILLCCNLWVEACKPQSLLAKVGLVITIVTFGIYTILSYLHCECQFLFYCNLWV